MHIKIYLFRFTTIFDFDLLQPVDVYFKFIIHLKDFLYFKSFQL